mgnify:CR=1 FL=1
MKPSSPRTYTCADYREEMRLLALQRRLQGMKADDPEREQVLTEIRALERAMAMD